jgi:hypothetical protein
VLETTYGWPSGPKYTITISLNVSNISVLKVYLRLCQCPKVIVLMLFKPSVQVFFNGPGNFLDMIFNFLLRMRSGKG